MTQDFTDDMRAKLIAYLDTHDLPSGLGDEHGACTLAAIRLAYDGQLNDDVIDCMSPVLGEAAMRLQDAMPDEMRNSARYKALIPNMPGTGREREAERLDILIDWLRTVVLPQLQPTLLNGGLAYAVVADVAVAADAADAADVAVVADVAVAADAADAAAADAADADAAARAVARAAYAVARAAAAAAARAYAAAAAAARRTFWEAVDPIGVLERMTYLEAKS